MPNVIRYLTPAEYDKANAERMELGKKRGNDTEWMKAHKSTYGWATLDEITGPCVMWSAPWYYDPADPEDKIKRDAALAAIANGTFGTGEHSYYLSRFYWQDWSDKRAPLIVLCPNGREWCVDAKSSNGEGWKVQGEPPKLIVTPSIQVPGYHGWLGSNGAAPGVFSAPLP